MKLRNHKDLEKTPSQAHSNQEHRATRQHKSTKAQIYQGKSKSSGPLKTGKNGESKLKASDNLLQAYLDDHLSFCRRHLYIDAAVKRFLDRRKVPANERAIKKKKVHGIITRLAKHEDIFRRLLGYASESEKRDFSKVTYSEITSKHTTLMGVLVQPHIAFSELASILDQTTLSETYLYPARSAAKLADFADIFREDSEVPEMPSTAETNARFRISSILKKIISRVRGTKLMVVGEELSLGYCGDSICPIEIQHTTNDGTILSTFVSGRLDYVCFGGPSRQIVEAIVAENEFEEAEALELIRRQMFRSFTGIRFVDFMDALEQNLNQSLEELDSLDAGFRWDVFVLEAKHMNERFSYSTGILPKTGVETAVLSQDANPQQHHPSNGTTHNRDSYPPQRPRMTDTLDATRISTPSLQPFTAQSQAFDSDSLSPLQILASNPLRWMDAFKELSTLSPETFIDAALLDQYLLAVSASHSNNCHTRYIPFHFLHSSDPDDEEVASLRRLIGIPDHVDSSPLEPVVGVIHQYNHFYVVVVLPRFQEVHVLGKDIQSRRQYQAGNGRDHWQEYLSGIALYFGWDMHNYLIMHTDWPQNGFDCGAIACQVVTYILRFGFVRNTQGFWDMPALLCAHKMRRSMALMVFDETTKSLSLFYSLLCQDNPALLERFYGSDLQDLQRQVHDFGKNTYQTKSCLEVLEKLDCKMLTCEACMESRSHGCLWIELAQGPTAYTDPSFPQSDDGSPTSNDSLDEIEVNNLLLEGLSFSSDTGDESNESTSQLPSSGTADKDKGSATGDGSLSEEDLQSPERRLNDPGYQADKSDTDGAHDASCQYKDSERRNNKGIEKDSIAPVSRPSQGISPVASRASNTNTSSGGTSAKRPRLIGLKKHLPQVIGQCLAIYAKIDAESQKPGVIKFGISSSNDWLFGLLDCTGNTRFCYMTDTLTVRNEEDLKDMIFLLLTWMIVPGHEVLQHFPKSNA